MTVRTSGLELAGSVTTSEIRRPPTSAAPAWRAAGDVRLARGDRGAVEWRVAAAGPVAVAGVVGVVVVAGLVAAGVVAVVVGVAEVVVAGRVAAGVRASAVADGCPPLAVVDFGVVVVVVVVVSVVGRAGVVAVVVGCPPGVVPVPLAGPVGLVAVVVDVVDVVVDPVGVTVIETVAWPPPPAPSLTCSEAVQSPAVGNVTVGSACAEAAAAPPKLQA
jgi:hypothetical protein